MPGPNIAKCWICGENPANTREHRVLRARLSLYIEDGVPILVKNPNERDTIITSVRAKPTKFGKSICSTCNGSLSQPWDKAYLDFVSRGDANPNLYRGKTHIKWADREEGINLTKYYAKNVGCRLIDRGQMVPTPISSFLRGERKVPPFCLYLIEDYDWLDRIEALIDRGWNTPVVKPNYSRKKAREGSPECVFCLFHEGPYAVLFYFDSEYDEWETFPLHPVSPIHTRYSFPESRQISWDPVDILLRRAEELFENGEGELLRSPDGLIAISSDGTG